MTQQYGLARPRAGFSPSRLIWFPLLALLLLLAGSAAATQYIAMKTGYHAALGEPAFIISGHWIYLPWLFLRWRPLLPPELYDAAFRLGLMVFAIPLTAFLAIALKLVGKPKGIKDLHGSAHWAKMKEIQEIGLLDGMGVYVGGVFDHKTKSIRYLRHSGPTHILCFAPTRSGKGVGLILPTLLTNTAQSSLVFDIKGENWALTSGYRKSIGHTVLRFDPADPTGASATFNPLEEIRLESELAIPDVQNVATMLIDPEGKGLQDHWAKAGFSFIAGTLLHVLVVVQHKQKRCANLSDLCLALADESKEISEFFKEMLETEHEKYIGEMFANASGGKAIHDFVASSAREMMNKAEAEASGVVSTALVNLALYRDPVVTRNISRSDFHVRDLMNHDTPVDLYLVVSPNDQARLNPLMRLIINLVMGRMTEKMEFKDGRSVAGYNHQLLMMLDEFTALGKLDIIERAIAYCAGYGIKLYIIVQDIVQLNGKYGKDNALMANCHTRIAYAPNNLETAKVLSDLTGKTTVLENKSSISGKRGNFTNASLSVQETARALLTPDECMRLPGPLTKRVNGQDRILEPGDMLILNAGRSPIYGKQILYFKDETFMARAKMPAPAISDSLYPVQKVESAAKADNSETAPVSVFERYLESVSKGESHV